MAKDKVSVTLDRAVLIGADAEAQAAGMNRSGLIEQALRHEHLRIALGSYTTHTVPARTSTTTQTSFTKRIEPRAGNASWHV